MSDASHMRTAMETIQAAGARRMWDVASMCWGVDVQDPQAAADKL
jgi:hypothetical protein